MSVLHSATVSQCHTSGRSTRTRTRSCSSSVATTAAAVLALLMSVMLVSTVSAVRVHTHVRAHRRQMTQQYESLSSSISQTLTANAAPSDSTAAHTSGDTNSKDSTESTSISSSSKTSLNNAPAPPGPDAPTTVGMLYARSDKHVKTVFPAASSQVASLFFEYRVDHDAKGNGVASVPNDRFVFEVPHPFSETNTAIAIELLHRQDKGDDVVTDAIHKLKTNVSSETKSWNFKPCYHTVSCRDRTSKKWYHYHGPRYATKYAEPREVTDPADDNRVYAEPRAAGDPGMDLLEDVPFRMGAHMCDLFMVENVGYGPGRIHGIRVHYEPFHQIDRSFDHQQVRYFTAGTEFADAHGHAFSSYGGGRDVSPDFLLAEVGELYPGAIKIDSTLKVNENINSWLYVKEGSLYILLRAGHPFAQCEVAVGDTLPSVHPADISNNPLSTTRSQNRDGTPGKYGSSQLSVRIEDPNNNYRVTGIQKWQVPQAGTLHIGAPFSGLNTPKAAADKVFGSTRIRIDAHDGPTWVMGVRCIYNKYPYPEPKNKKA
jgi:hypothetical protein